MKFPRPRRWLVFVLSGMLIFVLAVNPRTLPLLARWLDVGGPPRKADAAVLLGGGLNTRPFVAAALVRGGWAPKILLNTFAAHPNELDGTLPSSFEVIVRIVEKCDVSRDCIVRLDTEARTTFDEARGVANYLAKHPAKRLMVVTEGPHTRRARWIFQRLLADQPVEIDMVSTPVYEFDNENWWQSEEGFLFVVSEYFKFFYYGLRYGWLAYEIGAGVAIITIFLYIVRLRRHRSACHCSLSTGGAR